MSNTTKAKATRAKTIPVETFKFSCSWKMRTPAKVGSTTDSLLESEVMVMPDNWVDAVISK